tara:strand:- start:190 stop:678 length:489 start_codon:yes stop_codon:yes gene_type:complete
MKKLILLLLFIPLVSFGQTYEDLMSINSVDMFKKVAIENTYEFQDFNQNRTDKNWIDYVYVLEKDSDNYIKWAMYHKKENRFIFKFSRTDIVSSFFGSEPDNSENPYDLITKSIKEKCAYIKIVTLNEIDFVTYSCVDSSFNGNVGFTVHNSEGWIRHFPSN